MINETELMAYLDGELSAASQREVEAAIAAEPGLQMLVRDELMVRQAIGQFYDPVLEEPIPSRLMRPLANPGQEKTFAELLRSVFNGWRWRIAAPLTAALAIGFFGITFMSGSSSSQLGASPAVAIALDTQLRSSQEPDSEVLVGITFAHTNGDICRTYETSTGSGVACHEDGTWRIELFAEGDNGVAGQYRQANTTSAAIMSKVQEMIDGEPMNAEQEQKARDAGWIRGFVQ